MTTDQQTLLMFKGLIASLPAETQAKVKQAEKLLRDVLADYPKGEATIAFGLIGAELQMDETEIINK
ncbi:TPA: hypothetical protein ACVBYD_000781 [Yersinia enterocolitica]|uniref:hypothetical protein n=1 Tax=Yersinia enterocolitica TaxID=630 RepID=UPI002881A523|nr:hypothetical protein [Yersinia enterocolitica]HDL6629392.1 hypothetical protein [Yersinia enterocolitica]HDL6656383.1 hypothetical protein [Yersinia enterocolitica]HDL6681837.1 hypothetical protein [Yersinia enterocolitica]HDL6700268.1 hypothetical protein [Yersinia enterocolitica]